jgi:hypothetical protein
MLSERVNEAPCHEDAFLTLELNENKCSISRLLRFTNREVEPQIPTE